jgi:hypothetical protein
LLVVDCFEVSCHMWHCITIGMVCTEFHSDKLLEAVNRPAMIVGATKDEGNFYDLEASYIYDHLGTPDRLLVSFIGQGHGMIFNNQQRARMAHFAVAFFGYHLQEQGDYVKYFSQEFIDQYSDLSLGVVER